MQSALEVRENFRRARVRIHLSHRRALQAGGTAWAKARGCGTSQGVYYDWKEGYKGGAKGQETGEVGRACVSG